MINFECLNDNQKMAASHFGGPCMVLAGPGSGKTRVISYRIINLIENYNINPQNILAITFTRASALEMKERSLKLSKLNDVARVNFGTFHSVFFKILRSFKNYKIEQILDEKEKLYILKNILKSVNIENGEDDELISTVINEISLLKNELMDINDFNSNIISKEEFSKIYSMYEKYKLDMKKIDFDDMLIHTYKLLSEDENTLNIIRKKYKYILVDEFQDINKVQFEVLKLISSPLNNIFIVGDEDQSIYGFRGARPDFLLEFEKYFENVNKIILDINYRSTDNIINSANKLIFNNKKRYEKVIKGVHENNFDIEFMYPSDSEEEAKKIGNIINEDINKNNLSYSDFAVIYRTNIQARALIDVFLDMNIPFIVRDTIVTIYDHWIAKDIISYLKVALDNSLKEEFSRIINRPFRYISKENIKIAMAGESDFLTNIKLKCNMNSWQIKNIESLEIDIYYMKNLSPKDAISYIRTTLEYDRYLIEYCEKRKIKNTGLFEILNEIEGSASNFKTINEYLQHIDKVKDEMSSKNKDYYKDSVVFTTIHSAKGLEFKNVFISGAIEGVLPHEKSLEEDEIEEERRLFYVAMTRAMDKLYILSCQNKYGKKAFMSRFVEEIHEPSKEELNIINVGDKIFHKIFKDGKVIHKDNNKIQVKFKDNIKIFDYILCLKNKLIKKIEI